MPTENCPKTLLSFTDIPKSQTLIPLKSQKTVVFATVSHVVLEYNILSLMNTDVLPKKTTGQREEVNF
jgi:hypothetical protein